MVNVLGCSVHLLLIGGKQVHLIIIGKSARYFSTKFICKRYLHRLQNTKENMMKFPDICILGTVLVRAIQL